MFKSKSQKIGKNWKWEELKIKLQSGVEDYVIERIFACYQDKANNKIKN